MSDKKTDRVYFLDNGEKVVPEKRLKREKIKNKQKVVSLFNRLGSAISSRAKLLAYLGKSFSGNRDLYEICGYPRVLTYEDYRARYDRQELAKACIDRPINSSWRKKPIISDSPDPSDKESQFEKDYLALVKRLRVYNYLKRLDTLSSIGQYAVLLLGFNDGEKLDQPITTQGKLELKYISVYSEAAAKIVQWDEDQTSERYALPVIYSLITSVKEGSNLSSKSVNVHFTRIMHVACESLESDVYGTPQMQAIYNRLQELETISAGSAEMYWKGARPGVVLSTKEDYDFDENAKTDLDTELDEYDHEIRRFMRLQGLDVKQLLVNLKSPKEWLDSIIDLIAAGRNIPKRILMGSERGELASSQDKGNWDERMESRREDYIEPVILRKFIDILIEYKSIAKPFKDEYYVEWPEFEVPGEKAIVDNANVAAEALSKYMNTPGIETIMPPEEFLMRFFKYEKEEAIKLVSQYQDLLDKENEDINEDDLIMEDEVIDDNNN